MKARYLLPLILLASTLCASMPCDSVHARSVTENGKGDSRVQELLERTGWNYAVDNDGDFKLGFRFNTDGRSQIVFVNSSTANLAGLEVREVWAPAIPVKGDLNEQLANDLLRENNRTKVGAWRLIKTRQGYMVVFAAQIAADADKETFMTIVRAVAVTADEKEKKVTEEDKL